MCTVWQPALLMTYSFRARRQWLKLHLNRYSNLYSSAIMCIAIIVAIGIIPPRGSFFSGVLSMLLAANLLPWLGAERHSAMPAAMLSAIMTAVIVPGIYLQMPRTGSRPCRQPSRQERKE